MNAALELVNSEWWRGRADRLDDKLRDESWLRGFAEQLGVALPAPTDDLMALRTVLRALVDGNGDVRELDGWLGRAHLHRRVVDGAVTYEPVARDWDWALSEIAASYLALAEPARIKTCANHECQWSFYDESKNRSRRWCGAATCGTADKVRRFRARQRGLAA